MLDSPLHPPHARRRVLARASAVTVAALLGVSALGIVGCASNKAQEPQAGGAAFGGGPMVISGSPTADTAAFNKANRSLLQAHHGVIEDVAPKPVWRSFRNDRDLALSGAMDAGDPEQGIPTRTSTAIGDHAAAAAPATESAGIPYADAADLPGPVGNTDPSIGALAVDGAVAGPLAPQYLNIQPVTQPREPVDFPLTRQLLPDGRVRLIWHLRSYGGPNVTTAGNGGTARRAVTLTPKDLAPLIAVLQGHLADKGQILPLAAESKLVITCAADAEDGVLALLDDLDVPAPQVEITAKIFEVSHNFDYQQGAKVLMNRIAEDGSQQALSAFQTQRLLDSVANTTPFQGSVVSLMQTFSEAGISLDAQFEVLAEAGLINVVSSPLLTVAEGQTGYMLAGQELPIQKVNIVNNVLHAATEYKPVGVQLYITPQAIGGGMIKLHTVSIVSSVSGFTALPSIKGDQTVNPLFMNPIIDSREAETAVTVPEGETLVISGMRMVRTTTREDKVPGLGDIPLIGNLFKSHRSQQQLTDLYFFVTPTLASAAD
jgi:type II secretory pathway component GspD/PulD (secretin)